MHLYSKRHEHRSLYCVLEEHDIKLCAERKVESNDILVFVNPKLNDCLLMSRAGTTA